MSSVCDQLEVVTFLDLAKRRFKDQRHRGADTHFFLVATHAEHLIEIHHRADMDAQLRVDLPAIRFEAEANLDELFRLQQPDQKRMSLRPVQLKQIGLVVQRKLHDVRACTDIARDKRRFGFGIESYDARRLDLGSGGRKLFPAARYLDVRKCKADKRLQQRDLSLGRGDFLHVRR